MGNTLTVFGVAISPAVLQTAGYLAAGAIGWAVRHWFPQYSTLATKIITVIFPPPSQPLPPAK